MILALIAIPAACALLCLVLPARWALAANAAAAVASLVVAAMLADGVLASDTAQTGAAGYLRADGLGVTFAVVVAAAAAVAALVGMTSFEVEGETARNARRYAVLASALTAALLCTVLTDHLGVMWIAMELSAVLAAFLVGFRGDRAALEAAFKYMILGSAGLVFGLLAMSFVYQAGVKVLGHGDAALSFEQLRAIGPSLDRGTMRLALALAGAGYGLKIGLFPLHVWKPDAYAAAPAPVAGLLAGAAVAVPMCVLLRYGVLTSAAGEAHFTTQLFVGAGLLSVVAAMILIVRETDLRRILAFTSVEHMGFALLACGLDPAAMRGGLLHLLANGTLKALAFGVLGYVVRERGTGDTLKGPGLFGRSYTLAGVFLLVMGASLGFPPFALFASELTVLRALFSGGHTGLGLVVLFGLAAIFGVVATGTLRVVFARSDQPLAMPGRHGTDALVVAAPVLLMMAWAGVGTSPSLWAQLLVVAKEFSP
ncbi:MAG: proton-conducting transporter transmembrane domain-containing protein [Myxococcaceae bacterium]